MSTELKRHLKFLKLLDQARQAKNWTCIKLDDTVWLIGKKEMAHMVAQIVAEATNPEVTPEATDRTEDRSTEAGTASSDSKS
jgi:hypothetical protein